MNRFWIKKLTADVASDTNDVADLKFTNLVVGKNYRISYNNVLSRSVGNPSSNVVHNSIAILRTFIGGGAATHYLFRSIIITAAHTDLTVTFDNGTSGGLLLGNNTTEETYLMLEEISDAVEVA